MQLKRNRVNYTFAKIGDPVRSKKVGACEAFDGEIVEVRSSRAVVRDQQGRLWIRNWNELEVRAA